MAEPSFIGEGTTQRAHDTRWLRWVKILSRYQNASGSLAANNAARGDGIRIIKQKTLCAIKRTSYTG